MSDDQVKQPQGVSFITASLIALLFSGFSAGMSVWYMKSHAQAGAGSVVVIDSKRIIEKRMKQIMATPNMTPEKAADEGKKTGTDLNAVMDEYRANGFVVINSAVALAWPSNLEATSNVASRLGISLE